MFIETGVSNVEAFPIGSVYGIGFEYAIGSGVVVTTGSSMNEFNSIYFYASLGEVMFVGSGLVIGTGSPFIEYIAIVSENMQGGAVFLGAGYASFVGCPFSEWLSIASVAGAGEYVAVDGESAESSRVESSHGTLHACSRTDRRCSALGGRCLVLGRPAPRSKDAAPCTPTLTY